MITDQTDVMGVQYIIIYAWLRPPAALLPGPEKFADVSLRKNTHEPNLCGS